MVYPGALLGLLKLLRLMGSAGPGLESHVSFLSSRVKASVRLGEKVRSS